MVTWDCPPMTTIQKKIFWWTNQIAKHLILKISSSLIIWPSKERFVFDIFQDQESTEIPSAVRTIPWRFLMITPRSHQLYDRTHDLSSFSGSLSTEGIESKIRNFYWGWNSFWFWNFVSVPLKKLNKKFDSLEAMRSIGIRTFVSRSVLIEFTLGFSSIKILYLNTTNH